MRSTTGDSVMLRSQSSLQLRANRQQSGVHRVSSSCSSIGPSDSRYNNGGAAIDPETFWANNGHGLAHILCNDDVESPFATTMNAALDNTRRAFSRRESPLYTLPSVEERDGSDLQIDTADNDYHSYSSSQDVSPTPPSSPRGRSFATRLCRCLSQPFRRSACMRSKRSRNSAVTRWMWRLVAVMTCCSLLYVGLQKYHPLGSNHWALDYPINQLKSFHSATTTSYRPAEASMRLSDDLRRNFNKMLSASFVTLSNSTTSSDTSASASSLAHQLPSFASPAATSIDKLRVCIFTNDIPESRHAGGTATAYYMMAKTLASMPNVDVHMLGVIEPEKRVCNSQLASLLQVHNITLHCLEDADFLHNNRRVISIEPYDVLGHAVINWVRRHPQQCDVMHGHEWGGIYGRLALQMQLNPQQFPDTRMVIETHGGHMWSQHGTAHRRPTDLTSFRIDYWERLTIEWADLIISPSRYMLGYLATRGWSLSHRYVVPNIIEGTTKDVGSLALLAASSGHGSSCVRAPVRQLCFFGRLEERKGIKVFADALELLSAEQPDSQIEVFFVGSNARVDEMSSKEWLDQQLAMKRWSFKTVVHIGLPRSKALQLIQQPGILLVIPSLIENLPYVVAEAVAMGIPLITFDKGGSKEILQIHADDEHTLCPHANSKALAQHLQGIMLAGSHCIAELSPAMTQAAELWQNWHLAYQHTHQVIQQQRLSAGALQLPTPAAINTPSQPQTHPDLDTMSKVMDATLKRLSRTVWNNKAVAQYVPTEAAASGLLELPTITVPSNGSLSTADLYNTACIDMDKLLPGMVEDETEMDLVLLLPENFQLIAGQEVASIKLIYQLFSGIVSSKHMQNIGGMTFGVEVSDTHVSYGSAPTWILYSQDGRHCEKMLPIVVRRKVLCQSFSVDPHSFPEFDVWIFADVLALQNMQLATYPEVLFQYRSDASMGQPSNLHPSSCNSYTVPDDRYTNAAMLDHMHRDVSEDMRDAYIKRSTAFEVISDFSQAILLPSQYHRQQQQDSELAPSAGYTFADGELEHWKVGAIDEDRNTHWFTWYAAENLYACPSVQSEWTSAALPYPNLLGHTPQLHPCFSNDGHCCGGKKKSTSLVRYMLTKEYSMLTSHWAIKLAYESNPQCGDGLLVSVNYTKIITGKTADKSQLLYSKVLEPVTVKEGESSAKHDSVLLPIPQFTSGDYVDITVDPLTSMDCDGFYLNLQIVDATRKQ